MKQSTTYTKKTGPSTPPSGPNVPAIVIVIGAIILVGALLWYFTNRNAAKKPTISNSPSATPLIPSVAPTPTTTPTPTPTTSAAPKY